MKKQPQITDATRKSMLDAFWAVYQKTPLERIAVKDISDAAHVHRSTFYRYFADIYDVLNQFEQNLLAEITATLEQILANARGPQDFIEIIFHAETIAGLLKGYAPAIYHLTSPGGDPSFRSKLRGQMLGYFSRFSFSVEQSLEMEYLFNFIFTNLLANLNFWYEHREQCTLEQISVLSRQLVSSSITGYVKEVVKGIEKDEFDMHDPWYDDLKKDVIIDLADCKYYDDFHRALKEAFMFPDYYGRNWDAFWDCLTEFCISHKHDIEIRISGFHKMPKDLQKYAQKMFEILNRAHDLYPNISYTLLS